MSRRNRPGRSRAQPRDVEVDAVPQDGEGRAGPMAVEVVPIDDLSADPGNLRTHDARSNSGIEASLKRFGPARSIVVDGKGVVRAGNGTLEAARRAGITDVLVIEPKPGQLVAVRRSDWSPSEATGYAISDNRLTDLSSFDEDALGATLRALHDEDFDLDAVGFTDTEVDALFAGAGNASAEEDGDGEADDGSLDGPKVFDAEAVIESAFHWFRKTGFPYRNLPIHVCMQEINRLAASSAESMVSCKTAYYVADTYHRHRLAATAEGMMSPVDAFEDDDLLRRAIRLKVECGRNVGDDCLDTIPVISGTQACSNFRPGFACRLYREYCEPGATVLDTSTGYGGRLVGFIASGMAGLYIGVDPNTKTHAGNLRMAEDLGFGGKVELHNLPAEDVSHEVVLGRCDFAFTSPPYFRKEHYSEEPTQSWKRYQTGDAWRDGFLLPMLGLQFAALKPGKYAIVNIADVTIKGKPFPLVTWTVAMADKVGFRYVRTDEFAMQKRFGAGHDDDVAIEPVLVFRKP
jgi:hypothetical protein